jgi:hypothetical protein
MKRIHDIVASAKNVNEEMIGVALEYLSLGYKPIALLSGTKQANVKWKRFQGEQSPDEREIRTWFKIGRPNVALVTGGNFVVVDVDEVSVLDLALDCCGNTPMRCRTPRGVHLYYSTRPGAAVGNAVRIGGMPIDLRGEGGYVLCPWSRSAQGAPYEWLGDIVPAADLPPINLSWLRERTPKRVAMPAVPLADAGTAARRARGYLAHVEGAIAGRRGHDRTFRVACVLTIKFGLTLDQAWPLMNEWNEQCEPPWSEKELLHKLQDALHLRFRF